MKIPAKYLAAASAFQAKNDLRFYLIGVSLIQKPDHVEIAATNGHILLKIDHESEGEECAYIVSFSADQLRDIRKKGNADKLVSIDFQTNTMELNDCVSPITIVDGRFPDYSKIIPESREPNGVAPAFNATYWDAFAKAAVLLSTSKDSPVRVCYGAANESALVEFPESPNAVGVIMPVRV